MSKTACDANHMVEVVRRYYEGCNEADVEKMAACFTVDAVHYFPDGAPQGPFRGAKAIAEGWRYAVNTLDSRWTIDHLVLDEAQREVVIEWTHWKPALSVHLRGVEICSFSVDGLISEIRAFYAAPAAAPSRTHELGSFDYATRGYALTPPQVQRATRAND